MGQQNSHVQHISTNSFDVVAERRVKPPRPSEPPHRPVSLKPKQPSYAVPENKVLPFALPEKRLRPVSADLSKFHPEYKDIFNSSFEEDQLMIDISNKENEKHYILDTNIPKSEEILKKSFEKHDQIPNGNINFRGEKRSIHTNEEKFESMVSREQNDKHELREIPVDTRRDIRVHRTNTLNVDNRHRDKQNLDYQHTRVNSLDRSSRIRGHRRFPSVTTNLTTPENTILEDPSESLDNSRRGDPSMSYSGTSLPKQNTFDMDYKYQLTYTQLAEHRRAKHLAEIEQKTGKRLSELSADLAENTDWGKAVETPTIKRHNSTSVKSRLADSMSTDSTLEKKKKRAPPPPRQQSASPPRQRSATLIQKQNSAPVPPIRYNRLSSPNRYPEADYDMDTTTHDKSHSKSIQRSNSQREADAIGRIDSILNAKSSQLANTAVSVTNDKDKVKLQGKDVEKQNSVPLAPPPPTAEQLNSLQMSRNAEQKDEKQKIEQEQSNDTNTKDTTSETKSADSTPSKPGNNMRRMSSLLKHDIISTAQARTTILDKKTTPVTEKPKDPHQIFREQLEKACNKREERLKDSNIDDMIPSLKKPQMNKNKKDQKNTSQVNSVDIQQADKNKNKFSDDWAPEDDLSSDDDDMNAFASKKAGVTEGFKSNIIPTKMKEMKGSKRYIRKQQSLVSEKNKQGSLRKFKKSVRKSVSNAFDSLSKASGIMIRKSKPEEETAPPDTHKNWGLRVNESFTSTDSNAAVRREKYSKSRMSRHIVDDDSELSSDEEIRHNQKLNNVDHKNSFDADVETDVKEAEDKTPHKMKRAGVAYIGKNGQILVLPEYETIQVDETGKPVDDQMTEGRAPKIHNRRKKKFTFESSAKKKEREKLEEQLSEQIHEKEVQIEDERHKQLEMELEFRRLRELENKEKFQRYQTAQMQQQLNAALQQQHNLSALTAPQLPPVTGLPTTHFGLDYGQNIQFSPLITSHPVGGNIGLGVLNPSIPNGHVYNSSMLGGLPTPYNSFPDYSKLLNQQLKPSPQHYAFLLNNINLSSSNPFEGQNYPFSLSQSDPEINALFSGNKYNSLDKKEDILDKILKSKLPADVLSATVETNPVKDNENNSSETANIMPSAKDISSDVRDNPLYWSSDEEKEHLEGRTVVRSNIKSGVVKIRVSDHGDATITDIHANTKNMDNTSTTSSSSQSSPQSAAKIYGPLGFRRVSFEHTKNHRPVFEQEESNDSGISER